LIGFTRRTCFSAALAISLVGATFANDGYWVTIGDTVAGADRVLVFLGSDQPLDDNDTTLLPSRQDAE
jgi:hypothetical protein